MLVTCIVALTGWTLAVSPSTGADLGLDLSSDKDQAPPEAGAVLVVPWGKGLKLDAAAHTRLISALEAEAPGRWVSTDKTFKAVHDNKLLPSDLKTPAGIDKLASAVWAYRAVAIETTGKDVLFDVYDTDAKTKLKSKTVPNAYSMGKGELAQLAKAIAGAAIEPSQGALVPKPPGGNDTELLQPLTDEGPTAGTIVLDKDLEEAMKGPIVAPPKPRIPKPPFFRAAVGAGVGFGNLNTHGPSAPFLAKVQVGAVPDIVVYLGFEPIHLANPRIANAAWSDVLVEATFRRAFAHASTVTADGTAVRCTMEDDEVMVRLGWRYRFATASSPYLPAIGVGAGWGQDRLRFNCGLPVASTTFRAFDVNLRYLQPLYKKLVWIELVGGPRFGLGGSTTRVPGPAIGADLWAYWQITWFLYVRGGVRLATTRLDQQPTLGVTTLRTTVALELGVSL